MINIESKYVSESPMRISDCDEISGLVEIELYVVHDEASISINKAQAQQIINHLKFEFGL